MGLCKILVVPGTGPCREERVLLLPGQLRDKGKVDVRSAEPVKLSSLKLGWHPDS